MSLILVEADFKKVVNCFREEFGGGVGLVKANDTLTVSCFQNGIDWIVRVDTHCVIILIEKLAHEQLDDFEVADHLMGVEFR